MSTSLIISEISLYKLRIALKEPFVISLGPVHAAENLLVRIKTNEGITGFGECSPFLSINGESVDTCFIVGQYFAKLLKGKNPLDIKTRVDEMDRLIYANTSVKSAFDIALHDIASQEAGLPLYAFLGGTNSDHIFTDYTVSIGEPDKMAADALAIKNSGYPAIKIKVGSNGKKDVTRIAAIRKAVGPTIPLRIDANQGWSVDEAIETLNALAIFNIQHCEEPIARWNYMSLPRIKKASPIPIMADESCGDVHDAQRLLDIDACDYFNIKIGKAGGLLKAKEIVDLAKTKNFPLQVGAFMESRLAMTAFAHFSMVDPLIHHHDFDTALMFAEDPVTAGITYSPNGKITLTETPGLGATISDMQLKKFESITI